MPYIELGDLAPFADIEATKAEAMIADALAQAKQAAPCLKDETQLDVDQIALVRSVLRSAILRWNERGSGVATQQTVGPFSMAVDTRTTGARSLLQPSEISTLQEVCRAVTGAAGGKAFSVDTAPAGLFGHAPWCDLFFSGAACSCGYDLAGTQLWEW